MVAADAIDLTRNALWIGFLVGSPVLLAGMIVGLLIGLLQALTQIQEQTIAFVPKIIVMIAVFSLAMPWLVSQLVHYSSELIRTIPGRF